MEPEEIITFLSDHFQGIVVLQTKTEYSIFFEPEDGGQSTYFASIKDHDSASDTSSELNRERIYRFSIRVPQDVYEKAFGHIPRSAVNHGVLNAAHDADQLNVLHPHPKHAHLAWVCILSPSWDTFYDILPFIREAYDLAVIKTNKLI